VKERARREEGKGGEELRGIKRKLEGREKVEREGV
jgi:hypothetical protein